MITSSRFSRLCSKFEARFGMGKGRGGRKGDREEERYSEENEGEGEQRREWERIPDKDTVDGDNGSRGSSSVAECSLHVHKALGWILSGPERVRESGRWEIHSSSVDK